MFRGFYTAASGMIAQQRRTELLSNNMANLKTPGFKQDQSVTRSFPDMLLSQIGKQGVAADRSMRLQTANPIGSLNAGVYVQEMQPLFEQGQLRETGFSTDFALQDGALPQGADPKARGGLLFRLQNPDGPGELYTRNGNFTLDADGYLVDTRGLHVLSDRGQRIRPQSTDFQVASDGSIAFNGGAAGAARIGVAYSADARRLAKQGNDLYAAADNAALPDAYTAPGVGFSVQQGHLEQSNVDPARAMTDLLQAYRAFEANQKVLVAYDRTMDRAANEIGRVN